MAKDSDGAAAAPGETPAASDEAAAEAAASKSVPSVSEVLQGLIILPPRQQTTNDVSGEVHALVLPPIRPEEPVQSIKAALAEVVGLAHITNYRLEVEPSPAEQGNNVKKISTAAWDENLPLVSPYTGPDAVVSVPVAVKSLDQPPHALAKHSRAIAETVLDEWGDLSPLQGLQDGTAFRIVLQRYDVATVKDHIFRLRTLLQGNIPALAALVEEEEGEQEAAEAQAESKTDSAPQEEQQQKQQQQSQQSQPLKALPEYKSIDSKNLREFFYLASGQDPELYHPKQQQSLRELSPRSKRKKKKSEQQTQPENNTSSIEQELREKLPRWNQLDEECRVDAHVRWSGFHPPPANRKWMGDLAYLEFQMDGDTDVIPITATRTGFYVNRSTPRQFDPSPVAKPCFAHALLDCLLQASPTFAEAWSKALAASKERADLLNGLNQSSPHLSLFRVAVRTDFGGFAHAATAAAAAQAMDMSVQTPSWLVPIPPIDVIHDDVNVDDKNNAWTHNHLHTYHSLRAEQDDLTNTMGIDLRSGGIRDWNEELQLAREMPTSTRHERMERARLMHKVLTEFGEAALWGVKAISEGQIMPMNPNESMRTQVYLHNNIFFSRAIDSGPETFKIAKGDKAARKAAGRDLQCNSTFHRMETVSISTLATVLIDYLGTRFVCQSVLPGILIGDRAHKLLIGAVEAGVPLKWDKEVHKVLEDKIGESMMVASRPVLRNPLTKERLEEIQLVKMEMPSIPMHLSVKTEEATEEDKQAARPDAVMMTCMPIEAKAIRGGDHRVYVLDFGRLTPRDANWIPQDKGGTGKWEAAREKNGKSSTAIPLSLDDDEWAMCVLRPELVTRFTQFEMGKYIKDKKEKEAAKKAAEVSEKDGEAGKEKEVVTDTKKESEEEREKSDEKGESEKKGEEEKPQQENEELPSGLSDEDLAYLKTLRLNVNVFLPEMRTFEKINDEAFEQANRDEQRARDAAIFLWDEVLPKVTRAIRDGSIHQLPVDGKSLTEFLHRTGVNCRYMGRLAVLAQEQELRDAKTNDDLKNKRLTFIERRTMPKFWLELLECEMVARVAKHVLDSYLTEHGGVAASQPAQTIASFLSALVSESEETAAQTETRLDRRSASDPDEDDFNALTISDTGGDGDAAPGPIRSRQEVWQDIELEVGRHFRYSLTLFNKGNKSGRALYIPLLRRVCQRTGIRLVARNYDVGGKCLCTGSGAFGGSVTGSYPISPVDIVDIVPLMKHAAAYREGFYPCSLTPSVSLPPLHVSLHDARVALERAHIQANSRALNKGLELAQEALSLYQAVTETPSHPGVIESMELMASIFMDGNDAVQAASHGERALGLALQTGGFDSAYMVYAHLNLFQMLYSAGELGRCIQHLRAAIYLLEIMAGANHTEIFNAYHKLGSSYSYPKFEGSHLSSALKSFEEASKRDSCDRLTEGLTSKNYAKILAGMGEYKEALELEKKAFSVLSMFLGKEHPWVKESDEELKNYTKLAVEKGNRSIESEKMKEQAAKAEAVAAHLAAEEERSKAKKTRKKKGKK